MTAQIHHLVRGRRCVGGTVAARVVAQHPERARQRFGLRVPHAQVCAEGIAESQPRPALAIDAVVQAVGGEFQESHGSLVWNGDQILAYRVIIPVKYFSAAKATTPLLLWERPQPRAFARLRASTIARATGREKRE